MIQPPTESLSPFLNFTLLLLTTKNLINFYAIFTIILPCFSVCFFFSVISFLLIPLHSTQLFHASQNNNNNNKNNNKKKKKKKSIFIITSCFGLCVWLSLSLVQWFSLRVTHVTHHMWMEIELYCYAINIYRNTYMYYVWHCIFSKCKILMRTCLLVIELPHLPHSPPPTTHHFCLIYKRYKLHIKISQPNCLQTINQRSNCVCVYSVLYSILSLFIHSSNQNNNNQNYFPSPFGPRKWQPWQPTQLLTTSNCCSVVQVQFSTTTKNRIQIQIQNKTAIFSSTLYCRCKIVYFMGRCYFFHLFISS